MKPCRILTDAQIDEAATLREQGWSLQRIVNRFAAAGTHVSQGTINWQCLRVGADIPRERRQPSPANATPYRRGGGLVRPFTPAEDAVLRALDTEGLPRAEIARRIGRRPNAILGRLMILARRDAREETVA